MNDTNEFFKSSWRDENKRGETQSEGAGQQKLMDEVESGRESAVTLVQRQLWWEEH